MTDTNALNEQTVAAAAELVLAKLGLPLDRAIVPQSSAVVMPTFAEYVPAVAKATPASSREIWSYYWAVLLERWSERPIDEPRATEIDELANYVREQAAAKPYSRGGYGAKSNFIDAVKCLYRLANNDKLIRFEDSPVAHIKHRDRRPTPRRALTPAELAEIQNTAARISRDPHLASLVFRLHTETACRRGGAIALRKRDLNRMDCTIRLREKGGKTRDQPVSRTLLTALIEHVEDRAPGNNPDEQVLRRRTGEPLKAAYYRNLFARIGQNLEWAKTLGVTAHWLRYTTLTWVERNFGYAVAAAYAGHSQANQRSGATLTYVSASIIDVAAALSALVGEPHPLAPLAAPDGGDAEALGAG